MRESAYRSALANRLAAIRTRAGALSAVDLSWEGIATAKDVAKDASLLIEALEHVLRTRDDLDQTAVLFVRSAAIWKGEGATDTEALCLGQSMAYKSAAGHIDEAFADAFLLWHLYEADQANDQSASLLPAEDPFDHCSPTSASVAAGRRSDPEGPEDRRNLSTNLAWNTTIDHAMSTVGEPPVPGAERDDHLRPDVPHSARVWNYWLGGKDNYDADREMGDQVARALPNIVAMAQHDRAFLGRTVHLLIEKEGIGQFLDIGTGLPTANNTHEVAQGIAPDCRIVYVDNDPLVLVHARALLTSTPEGATQYIDADLRDPGGLLRGAAGTLDFDQPTAIMLLGILHFVFDDAEAQAIVRHLVGAVPSGSFVALTHATDAFDGKAMRDAVNQWNDGGAKPPLLLRDRERIAALLDGLELLEPGVVSTSRWRLPAECGEVPEVGQYAAVARKP